jgi:hypothetical protein
MICLFSFPLAVRKNAKKAGIELITYRSSCRLACTSSLAHFLAPLSISHDFWHQLQKILHLLLLYDLRVPNFVTSPEEQCVAIKLT